MQQSNKIAIWVRENVSFVKIRIHLESIWRNHPQEEMHVSGTLWVISKQFRRGIIKELKAVTCGINNAGKVYLHLKISNGLEIHSV